MIDVRSFGAVGDGVADDTAAFQKAIDKAAGVQATVSIPEGIFSISTLHLYPHTGLIGNPAWSYHSPGGSILRLNNEKAACLLDITGAAGVTLNGLSLEGERLGTGIHGILCNSSSYSKSPDTPRIERCRIHAFSGDGIRLKRIFAFHIRNSMSIYNTGSGLWVRGWDGFLLDNCLSGNGQAGFGSYEENASITMTGNRIEWNREGGIICQGGTHYNITGNYIDRSGGPGIYLRARGDIRCTVFAITGNVIFRSGKPEWCPDDEYASAHVRFEQVDGLVFTGNTMNVGRDDNGKGQFSPRYGIVYSGLGNSIIKDNVLHLGVLKELLVDRGNHRDGVLVKDNVGSVFVPGQTPESEINAVLADPAW